MKVFKKKYLFLDIVLLILLIFSAIYITELKNDLDNTRNSLNRELNINRDFLNANRFLTSQVEVIAKPNSDYFIILGLENELELVREENRTLLSKISNLQVENHRLKSSIKEFIHDIEVDVLPLVIWSPEPIYQYNEIIYHPLHGYPYQIKQLYMTSMNNSQGGTYIAYPLKEQIKGENENGD